MSRSLHQEGYKLLLDTSDVSEAIDSQDGNHLS